VASQATKLRAQRPLPGAPIGLARAVGAAGPKAKDNEEVRALLNAGHRKGAVAGRCVVHGATVLTEEIPAYCAVALAGLGWLPETILSRSIVIKMRRRTAGEKVEPFRRRVHVHDGEALCQRLADWAETILEEATDARPEMPTGVDDRNADVWEALLALADIAGGEWPERARAAATALVKIRDEEPSLGIRLLADLKTVFGDADQMSTADILLALAALDEAPWGDIKRETARRRADLATICGLTASDQKTL
jgi:hypothetical protein